MIKIIYKDIREDRSAPPCVMVRYYSVDNGETWMDGTDFAQWQAENIIIENAIKTNEYIRRQS